MTAVTGESTEGLYLGAYWGDRVESLAECAARLRSCVMALSGLDPLLERWYHKGGSAAARNEVAWDETSVERFLLGGRGAPDPTLTQKLGFRYGVWTGDDKVTLGLSGTCGAHPATAGVMNVFLLKFPDPSAGTEAEALYRRERLRTALVAAVDAWEPDWAVVAGNTLRKAQSPAPRTPFIGHLTYLSARHAVPPSPAVEGVTIEPLGPGTLITVVGAPPLERFIAVRDVLAAAGALRPTP
jgi:hypothetical protein